MIDIAQTIDHTCLKPTATEEDIKKLCEEAAQYHFKTVCVPACYVAMATHLLSGTSVGVTTVVGFPLGYTTTAAKAFEAREAVLNGASDIDMVINIGALKNKKYDYIKYDIEEVVKAAKETDFNVIVKVIIETCYLDEDEITKVTEIVVEAGADFVKTSTGFGTGGATIEHIKLMKGIVGDKIKIKASGGISSHDDAKALVAAGADRLGTSKSIAIITGDEPAHQAGY